MTTTITIYISATGTMTITAGITATSTTINTKPYYEVLLPSTYFPISLDHSFILYGTKLEAVCFF